MQYLKDDVKNKIVAAALAEFRQYGYLRSSMRRIAQAAGITAGNIYRYFTNKEELFDAIVGPTYAKFLHFNANLKREIDLSLSADAVVGIQYLRLIDQAIVELFKESSAELTILLNSSEGSKYESLKQELILLAYSILENVFVKAKQLPSDLPLIERNKAYMLATTIIEGLCMVLRDYDDGATIKVLVDELLHVYSIGIYSLLYDR